VQGVISAALGAEILRVCKASFLGVSVGETWEAGDEVREVEEGLGEARWLAAREGGKFRGDEIKKEAYRGKLVCCALWCVGP
jgi:hypothetical protein